MIRDLYSPLIRSILNYCDVQSVAKFSGTSQHYRRVAASTEIWKRMVSLRLPEYAHLSIPNETWGRIYRTQIEAGQALFRGIVSSTELDHFPLQEAAVVIASHPWIIFRGKDYVGKIYNKHNPGQLTPLQIGAPFSNHIFQKGIRIIEDRLICLGTETLKVFNLAFGHLLHDLNCPSGNMVVSQGLVFLDASRCAAVCNNTTIRLYDWRAGTLLQSFEQQLEVISALTIRYLRIGPELIIGDSNGEVAIQTIDEAAPRKFLAHEGRPVWRSIQAIEMAGTQRLVTRCLNEFKVWNLQNLQPLRIISNVTLLNLYRRVNQVVVTYHQSRDLLPAVALQWLPRNFALLRLGSPKIETIYPEDDEPLRTLEGAERFSSSQNISVMQSFFRGNVIGNYFSLQDMRTGNEKPFVLHRLFDSATKGWVKHLTPDETISELYTLQEIPNGQTSLRMINLIPEGRLSKTARLEARICQVVGLARSDANILLRMAGIVTLMTLALAAIFSIGAKQADLYDNGT